MPLRELSPQQTLQLGLQPSEWTLLHDAVSCGCIVFIFGSSKHRLPFLGQVCSLSV